MRAAQRGRPLSAGRDIGIYTALAHMRELSRHARARFAHALTGLPLIRLTDETFTCIDTWVPIAADRGHRFSLSDWLVAALAQQIGALVWSLDADFAEMARLSVVARFDR